jgi:hypothetical protein
MFLWRGVGYGCFHSEAKVHAEGTPPPKYQLLSHCEVYQIDPSDMSEDEEKKRRKWFTIPYLPKPRMQHASCKWLICRTDDLD